MATGGISKLKNTNCYRIKAKNVQRNLNAHRRRLIRYVDEYYKSGDGVSMSAAMIYPNVPEKADLRSIVEHFFHVNAIVVVWFNGGDAIISQSLLTGICIRLNIKEIIRISRT